ncbi:MAG: hypothetical protein WCG48_03630, partial [Candidatus Berkelbacteria bacterium]
LSDRLVISFYLISKVFKNGDVVSFDTLNEKGLLKGGQKAKIVHSGKLDKKISIGEGVQASKSVVLLIEKLNSKTTDETPAPKKEVKAVVKTVAKKPKVVLKSKKA